MQNSCLLNKHFTISVVLILLAGKAFAQFPQLSIATDISLQRNFKKEQRYTSVGQTINAIIHLTGKEAVYTNFNYYSNGKFKNDVTATAKSPLTLPQQINYVNSGKMRLKHFAIGYRKYLKGSADAEKDWNVYANAGLGIILGRIENTHSVPIDTSLYTVPVYSGKANFKRLTLDLAVGWEMPIGGDFFIYTEGRVWVPTTDYPSDYIFVNENAPFVGMLNLGLRIFFN